MSAADRRQIQTALARLGYDKGPVDGVFGPQTLAAIRRFQQAIGVEPTSVIKADEASRLVNTPAPATSRAVPALVGELPDRGAVAGSAGDEARAQRVPAELRRIEPRQ
jgi:peptidoglycan hydrolase-like protein with peptidoglycan-binding domain